VIQFTLVAILVMGMLICALNIFLSFVRPLWFRLANRNSKYGRVSGVPLVGSLMTVASLAFLRFPGWVFIAGILLAVADTGGIHWFIGFNDLAPLRRAAHLQATSNSSRVRLIL